MEMIDNPLHEAAKRGNVDFLDECIGNRVCHHHLSYINGILQYADGGFKIIFSFKIIQLFVHW